MHVAHPTTKVETNDANNDTGSKGDDATTQEKVKLYLPTAIPSDTREAVLSRLAELYGGFTIHHSRGGWVDDSGELITESVEVVESIAPNDHELETESVAQSTADWVARHTDEDVVMWEIEQTSSGMESGHV